MLQNATIHIHVSKCTFNLETHDGLKLDIIIWEMKKTVSLKTWLNRQLSQCKISLNIDQQK